MKRYSVFVSWFSIYILSLGLFLASAHAAIAPAVFGAGISATSGEAPLIVKLQIETSSSARGMKVLDNNGNELPGMASFETKENGNKVWILDANITAAYEGTYTIYIRAGENDWIPTDAIYNVFFSQAMNSNTTTTQPQAPQPEQDIDSTTYYRIASEEITVGDNVVFGAYEQNSNKKDGKEPVEWIVLGIDKPNNRALLLSKYVLDMQRFNQKWTKVSWEKCNVRGWLNGTFYKACFSNEEKKAIIKSDLESYYGDQYVQTSDNVFFLSADEARDYFSSNVERRVEPTSYAIDREVALSGANCYWWLRDASGRKNDANRVKPDGNVEEYGGNTNAYGVGIRPAIWVDLSAI